MKRIMNRVLFSSISCDWATPGSFFDLLNDEFHFDLDACASVYNHKCSRYFTIDDDSLIQDWSNSVVWCNPPYGRNLKDWVSKAYSASLCNSTVVLLLPSRTDTSWFHDYCLKYGEIRFIRGRLKFGDSVNPAPFPSMVVIFRSCYDK